MHQQLVRRRRSHVLALVSIRRLVLQQTADWILSVWSPEKQESLSRSLLLEKIQGGLTKLGLGNYQIKQCILVIGVK